VKIFQVTLAINDLPPEINIIPVPTIGRLTRATSWF